MTGQQAMDALVHKFQKLTPAAKHLLQLCAVHHEGINRTDLVKLSNTVEWRDPNGRLLAYADVRKDLNGLVKNQLLVKSHGARMVVNPILADFAVQVSIHQGDFDKFAATVQSKNPRHSYYYGYGYGSGPIDPRTMRDLRIAFYQGDTAKFRELCTYKDVTLVSDEYAIKVLSPFNKTIFNGLDPAFQERYVLETLPIAIATGQVDASILTTLDEHIAAQKNLAPELVPHLIDLAVARGDLAALRQLDERTESVYTEITGCEAMLRGEWDAALECFDLALKRIRGKSRKRKIAVRHLAGIFHVALLLKQNTSSARGKATPAVNYIEEEWPMFYASPANSLSRALDLQACPTSGARMYPVALHRDWFGLCHIMAGMVWQWMQPEAPPSIQAEPLERAHAVYEKLGMHWLEAESAALLGRLAIKENEGFTEKSKALHDRLQTVSIVNLLQPQPAWQRSLDAMRQLGGGTKSTDSADESGPDERIIWDLYHDVERNELSLKPIIQKRKKKGWTSGRSVALKRLHSSYNDSNQFPYLTDEDRAICGTLKQYSTQGGWGGYREYYFEFHPGQAAQAMVGHPRVFRRGNRTQPMEIVRREPQLLVTRTKKGIKVAMEPRPLGDDTFTMIEEGPARLAFIFFTAKHRDLSAIVGNGLNVPKSGEEEVLATLQSVASLVTIHSDVGGVTASGEAVEADPLPHLHLSPFEQGLRAEFFVQPFGNAGPLYRPGAGGTNVFADVDGEPKSTQRKLKDETKRASDVIAACPNLSGVGRISNPSAPDVGGSDGLAIRPTEDFTFPEAIDALELMVQLQPLVDNKQVQIHWPKGKALRIAGQADASQLKINIRRDRDWFAASGGLQVDDDLTLDMMKLIELVGASPTRFVQLDDGRFLALTDKFRQRIEEIAAFSEIRKNKVRFPAVRAAALEGVEDEFAIKADKHWKECVQRMREATSLVPKVPTTFQGEMRDYQCEGYDWLVRLAHWGVGACLADDMGLGKTIQAIALLLERASDGPALVVAPTSVAMNWQNELHRFAPTLNPKLFGAGDREAFLQDLGPRDVVITSYGLLYNEAERFQQVQFNTAILDEAQAIKNTATKRSQAAMKLDAGFRMIMTGTPLENHLGELWNLFQFINSGLLGSLESFNERFATPIERDKDRGARQRLKKLIQPFILRRTKTQVLDELPSRTEVTRYVDLSSEEAAFYEAMRQTAVQKLAESADQQQSQHLRILAEIMRLRRACCHSRLVMEKSELASSKLALFSETIDELLENRHKALVFSQFVDHLAILRGELDRKGVAYQYLDGSTPMKERQKRVDAFQSGEGDVFLISLKAGGTGLNLTAADYVLHMDPWWNPAVEDQASDRAHRLGQQRPVTIYRFVTRGTIEEQIVDLHANKRDLADSLLEGADLTGKLSAKALLKLIQQ